MDKNRIEDKIIEIEGFIDNLLSYIPNSFEEYVIDLKTKSACERCFEKIIEAAVDLAFMIIKYKNLEMPEEDKQAFEILDKSNIISNKLNIRLQEAKSMRNFIAHEYGKIDDAKVFHALTEELIPDVKEFIRFIEIGLNAKK